MCIRDSSRLVLADGKSDSSFSRAVFDTFFNCLLYTSLLSQPHDKVLTFEPMYDSFYTVIQDNDRQLVAHRLISKDRCV